MAKIIIRDKLKFSIFQKYFVFLIVVLWKREKLEVVDI